MTADVVFAQQLSRVHSPRTLLMALMLAASEENQLKLQGLWPDVWADLERGCRMAPPPAIGSIPVPGVGLA